MILINKKVSYSNKPVEESNIIEGMSPSEESEDEERTKSEN